MIVKNYLSIKDYLILLTYNNKYQNLISWFVRCGQWLIVKMIILRESLLLMNFQNYFQKWKNYNWASKHIINLSTNFFKNSKTSKCRSKEQFIGILFNHPFSNL